MTSTASVSAQAVQLTSAGPEAVSGFIALQAHPGCIPQLRHIVRKCESCTNPIGIQSPTPSSRIARPDFDNVLCAANTFIVSWQYRLDTYTTTSSSGNTTATLIGSLGATCSDGSTLQAATRQNITGSSAYVAGVVQSDATESQYGYSAFELTYEPLAEELHLVCRVLT